MLYRMDSNLRCKQGRIVEMDIWDITWLTLCEIEVQTEN